MKNALYASVAVLMLFAAPAYATNNNGNCGVGVGNGGPADCGGNSGGSASSSESSADSNSVSSSTSGSSSVSGAIASGGNAVSKGGKGGDALSIAKGGKGGSSVASGGAGGIGGGASVNGSGNSSQGQQQGQAQGQSTKVGGQSQSASNNGVKASNTNSTNVDARNQSRTNNVAIGDIDPIGGADSQDHCAMVRGGGFGVADGLIASGSVRWDVNDRACQTNRRAVLVSQLAGGDAGLLYLAQTDPAVCAVLEYRGIGKCEKSTARKNMRTPTDNNVARNRVNTRERGNVPTPVPAPVAVCKIKPGTTHNVITNWDDKMACARSLGL